MLKSSEHKKLWCNTSYKSPNFLDCSDVFYLVHQFQFTNYSVHSPSLVLKDNLFILFQVVCGDGGVKTRWTPLQQGEIFSRGLALLPLLNRYVSWRPCFNLIEWLSGTFKEILHKSNNKGYKVFTIGLNSNPFLWLVEIIKLRKGVIIWLHRKGRLAAPFSTANSIQGF